MRVACEELLAAQKRSCVGIKPLSFSLHLCSPRVSCEVSVHKGFCPCCFLCLVYVSIDRVGLCEQASVRVQEAQVYQLPGCLKWKGRIREDREVLYRETAVLSTGNFSI